MQENKTDLKQILFIIYLLISLKYLSIIVNDKQIIMILKIIQLCATVTTSNGHC